MASTSYDRLPRIEAFEDEGGPVVERAPPGRVADLVEGPAVKVPGWFTVAAARKIASLKGTRYLLVVDRRTIIGVVEVRDIERVPANAPVARYATFTEATVAADATPERAWWLMVAEDVDCLPVVRGPVLVGIITRDALMPVLSLSIAG
jgi:Mg/Co/Ni transporter MgtE